MEPQNVVNKEADIEADHVASIDSLPPELLSQIINSKSQQMSPTLSAVCKGWYNNCSWTVQELKKVAELCHARFCENAIKAPDKECFLLEFVALCKFEQVVRGYNAKQKTGNFVTLLRGIGSPSQGVCSDVGRFMTKHDERVRDVSNKIINVSKNVIVAIARLAFDPTFQDLFETENSVDMHGRWWLHVLCDVINVNGGYWISHVAFGPTNNGRRRMRFARESAPYGTSSEP